jgi:cytochrome c553
MRRGVVALIAGAAIIYVSFGAAFAQQAIEPPAGALSCSGCHAGRESALPSLEGKSAPDIEQAMAAFRAGKREATVMDRIAKGFNETETSAIAEWLARTGATK